MTEINDDAIVIDNVSKKYKLYSSNSDRVVEIFHPFRKKFHQDFWALQKVTFKVRKGEIIGVIGRNGSGKSTLLQMICSILQPTEGDINVDGRISALLELGAGFNPEFTGRENVILNGQINGFTRSQMLDKLDEIEQFADIGEYFDQPVKTYSSGMYVRVAFSVSIHVDPDILIVDEALSVGDSAFQHRCYQKIRDFMEHGKTILVVSHNTETLLRICHRGVVLEKGALAYIGSISSAVDYYHDILFGSHPDQANSTGESEENKQQKKYLERLSQGSEDLIYTKPYYNNHEKRLGNKKVQIIDLLTLVNNETDPAEIVGNTLVQTIIKVHFNEPVDNVHIGFSILTVDGVYVAGTNSEMMGGPFFSGKTNDQILINFNWKSHFVGGEYFLNIGCHHYVDGEVQFLDVRRSIAKIKFVDTPRVYGYTNFEMKTEIIDENNIECLLN